MHKIGDKIMYGAGGVMTIVDIREESVGDVSRCYYILRPTLARVESFTYVPVDNEKLVSAMRPLLSVEEIISLIRSAKDMSPIDWVNENRARQEYFKKIMESGDRAKLIAMIRAIDENGMRREAEGKKNFLSDENARAKAEKLLHSEFSVVLGIPEEEVATFIEREMQ
ncbi:MAG: hypothetical protein IJX58_06150 [Clostridia bacterium]|nr:hypothetical protein [Clostridia bacterium]